MAFNASQAGMAIFLLVACVFNAWFVFRSYSRSFRQGKSNQKKEQTSPSRYQLLTYAVLAMALFDILWVWLCMIQCWNNTLASSNSFDQNNGDDSFGCKFMGWYSSFSLVSMMGSHCLVAFYLMNLLTVRDFDTERNGTKTPFLETTKGFLTLTLSILVVAILFGSMPLMQGDGYRLTNGGFCYADFTNNAQSGVILFFVLAFLSLSTALWCKIGQWADYWLFYAVFFCTWILWISAACYGIATGNEIASPYMIVAAIIGHSNAVINPLLYGVRLFDTVDKSEQSDMKGAGLPLTSERESDLL